MQPLALVSIAAFASAQTSVAQKCTARGQNVTVSGYVMDNLCITRGTLLDNPSVKTLKNPDVHSIHCLVDVQSCVDSNYALLAPPANSSDLFSVRYQLGVAGTTTIKAHAEAARLLGGKKGLNIMVNGIDDGTGELKCVTASTRVMVDGKSLTLPATSTNHGAGLGHGLVAVVLAVASALLV